MRVLILFSSNPGDGFLIKLQTEDLIREIKSNIAKRDNSKAMVAALTKGIIEREVEHSQVYEIDAELILTKDRTCWDLTR